MKIKITRLDKTLPLPQYQTKGAVAFDLTTRIDTPVPPHSVVRIPCNVIIQTPKGYMLFLKDRSSTAMRKGLIATAGIIDQDFCGPEDEVLFQVYNPTDQEVLVEKGERVAQAIMVRVDQFELEEVDQIVKKSRGGFGTTGTK